ncbi:MAG: hypothetical protein GC146_08585 [Limimaricola sp.]|uniref:hypothetical protein n=1 Tax=Limimaricola sp. TaxID=2211665 RepID=UPI001E01BE6B|nr:hypothetical protein [Limimaricola sp.]MBI1417263.1 hypothetical protein [Limimaricola sp.]
MDYVVGISWPRSGHHMLVRLLTAYFGPDFGYCDFYGKGDCCRRVPCVCAGQVNLTKNHDFDLSVPQVAGQKYLVQYRDFVPSVISNFELHVLNGNPDTPLSFRRFASLQFDRYRDFAAKWLESDFAKRQLCVDYASLVADTPRVMSQVVGWLAPERPRDAERIDNAIRMIDGEKIETRQVRRLKNAGVHPPRQVAAFRHATPGLLDQLGRLRLRRAEVIEAFERLLGRPPREEAMLGFQCLESLDRLQEEIMRAPEFRTRARPSAFAQTPGKRLS